MGMYFSIDEIDTLAEIIQDRTGSRPNIAMILGSGLGALADIVKNPTIISYGDLPNWPVSTVIGHEGCLVFGEMTGQNVVIMNGRVHYYEGYSMNEVTLPVRVFQRLGVEFIFITNAAGAVNPDFEPGDLMLIVDHLNLLGMAGPNPLRGPNLNELGPRFPDMSRVYEPELADFARKTASERNLHLREGVYVCLAGPSFETPTDLRFLRSAGVDAVGMSTVPEAIVAKHGGLRVLGVSGISNKANLDGTTITTHEEVLEAGQLMVPKLIKLIEGVVNQI
jgi:purine-nucleoside phosphorylase